MDLEKKAFEYASFAHSSIGQVRKYTNEPYIVHPAAVAEIVRSVPHTPEMVAAAYLHDTVEDVPDVTIEALEREFGSEVADLVFWLTDVSSKADGNRRARKLIDLQHTAAAPARAQTIKIADIIDNAISISTHDQKFWPVFYAEASALLEVLTRGNSTLLNRAKISLRSAAPGKKY